MISKLNIILVVCLVSSPLFAEDKLQPANLDFSNLESELALYLENKPADKKKVESRRVSIVKSFKKMVQKLIERTPYEGKIYLKNKSLFGKIISADDNILEVETKSGSAEVKWEDMNIRQYAEIFIHAAVSKINSETTAEEYPEALKKAANFYFAIAVFYEWYKVPAASKIFREKALVLNPELQQQITQLWE